MNEGPGKLQWEVCVSVTHGPGFGHRLYMAWGSPHRDSKGKSIGSWQGLGIPEQVLNEARSAVDALLTEHLVTRYGVAGELPLKWAGEADPF